MLEIAPKTTNIRPIIEDPWWLLPGSGFNVPLEAKRIMAIFQEKKALSLSTNQAVQMALLETRGNLKGFWWEYLLQSPILPNYVEIAPEKGQNRLRNTISGQVLVDGISRDERLGAVADVMSGIEDELVNKDKNPDGTYKSKVVFFTSPDGPSGLKNPLGQDIEYADSQTYAFKRNRDGSLEAFTFVTDMTREENRQLLASLGVSVPRMVGDMEDVASIVQAKVVKTEDGEIKDFEDIVEKIQQVKVTSYARRLEFEDGRVEYKQFSEIYEGLARRKKLLSLGEKPEEIIAGFEKYILEKSNILENGQSKDLEKAIGLTVLEMVKAISGKEDGVTEELEIWKPALKPTDYMKMPKLEEYSQAIKVLSILPPGCNGGFNLLKGGLFNGINGVMSTPLGFRGISIEVSIGSKKCKVCNEKEAAKEGCGFCESCASRMG